MNLDPNSRLITPCVPPVVLSLSAIGGRAGGEGGGAGGVPTAYHSLCHRRTERQVSDYSISTLLLEAIRITSCHRTTNDDTDMIHRARSTGRGRLIEARRRVCGPLKERLVLLKKEKKLVLMCMYIFFFSKLRGCYKIHRDGSSQSWYLEYSTSSPASSAPVGRKQTRPENRP